MYEFAARLEAYLVGLSGFCADVLYAYGGGNRLAFRGYFGRGDCDVKVVIRRVVHHNLVDPNRHAGFVGHGADAELQIRLGAKLGLVDVVLEFVPVGHGLEGGVVELTHLDQCVVGLANFQF